MTLEFATEKVKFQWREPFSSVVCCIMYHLHVLLLLLWYCFLFGERKKKSVKNTVDWAHKREQALADVTLARAMPRRCCEQRKNVKLPLIFSARLLCFLYRKSKESEKEKKDFELSIKSTGNGIYGFIYRSKLDVQLRSAESSFSVNNHRIRYVWKERLS